MEKNKDNYTLENGKEKRQFKFSMLLSSNQLVMTILHCLSFIGQYCKTIREYSATHTQYM